MKELSLNVLDIASNSITAGARLIGINITEQGRTFELLITDNGCGMKEDILNSVTDPFTTLRTTRKVGLGLPFLKLAAEQTGGHISVTSRHESDNPKSHGTEVYALFYRDHIDFEPLGDIVSTLCTLIQGSPNTDFTFAHRFDGRAVSLDTRDLRKELGGDISLAEAEVIYWIAEYLREQYANPQQ